MNLEIESYGLSDIGLSRTNNEDVFAELPHIHFYVLADGMGGHVAGEVAAKEAVLQLCDIVDALFSNPPNPSVDTCIQTLKQGFIDTNKWVRTLAKEHTELSGMGTTLCCFLILGKTLIYAHVGDSRIYRFRHHTLSRLTKDHSLRQELLSNGEIDETSSFRYKNVITRAIGTTPTLEPVIKTASIQSGDIYFLCSDGLTDYVADSTIQSLLLKTPSLQTAAIELVETAKSLGGNDNITLLLVKIT